MELKELQEKYPVFTYERCDWKIEGNDLFASFVFYIGDRIRFNPNFVIHNIDVARIEKMDNKVLSNLVFHLGLAEIPSYWKATCSPKISIKAGYLKEDQIDFWRDLIFNMGQFFYENKLPFLKPEIEICAEKPAGEIFAINLDGAADNYLVPLGGGKDSLVTLELLRKADKEVLAFTLNANMALKRLIEAAGVKNVFVERKIDKKLIELNREGFLNGHTPFSSILSVLGAVLAVLFNCKYIAISQERSSNEGNVEYLGRIVNHQYSKTLEFENKFRKYGQRYIAVGLGYFSSLRPLYELQVTKIFSRYPQYFLVFLSCNKDFTVLRRENNINVGWCCVCPKCLCIFAMLYPFVAEKEIVSIFGQNLFDNEKLLPIMMELVGEGATSFKPFECVGTIRETRAAFYLSFKKAPEKKPYLLKMFEELVLPKYPEIDKLAAQTIEAWTDEHNLPDDLAKMLKNELFI